jgi:hypothetical protein
MKYLVAAVLSFFVGASSAPADRMQSAAPTKAASGRMSKDAPCAAAEYHQFDFWVGDWDSFDLATSKIEARAQVTSILGGCVLLEDYKNVDGHEGQSFTIYDATRKVWHQTWVTNHGELLSIEGRFAAGAMTLSGSDLTAVGEKRMVRGVWKPVEGGVRETAVVSVDEGKTWKPWFDIMFRAHKE